MAGYLIIESRDPFGSTGVSQTWDLASDLRAAGHDVTLFLVENGVLAARNQDRLDALADAGVEVLADDFALRERGLDADRLVAGVRPSPLAVVNDRLAEGRKALWN